MGWGIVHAECVSAGERVEGKGEGGKGGSTHHVVTIITNEQGLPEYLITSDGSVSF